MGTKLARAARRSGANSTDVARRAGISRATVSYVLNEVPNQSIPAQTRRRVLLAARELGYTVDPVPLGVQPSRVVLLFGVESCLGSLAEVAETTGVLGLATVVWCGDGDVTDLVTGLRPAVAICPVALSRSIAEAFRRHGIPLVNGTADGRGLPQLPDDPVLARRWAEYLVRRASAVLRGADEPVAAPLVDGLVDSAFD